MNNIRGIIDINAYKDEGWIHKLFRCPTFWKIKTSFKCPKCGKKYRCYWDGNDVKGHGVDYCNKCAKELEDE